MDRLADTGVLGRDKPSILRPTQHPVIDTATHQAVLDQVREAAAGQEPVPPDVAVVLALAGRAACWSRSRRSAAPAGR